MYFVSKELLQKRLQYIDQLVTYMEQASIPQETAEELAFQRAAQMLIEAILDVGNQMIDAYIMKDPGSYEDILHTLAEEHVLPQEEAAALVRLIPWRKILLQQYTEVDTGQAYAQFREGLDALKTFSEHIHAYLDKTAGGFTAFDQH